MRRGRRGLRRGDGRGARRGAGRGQEEHEEDYHTKGMCSFISEDMSLNCYLLFSYCFQMDGEEDDSEW